MPSVFLPVGHLQQLRDGECLNACAMMVLDYIEYRIAYARLLKVLDIRTGFGAPSYNIRNLARFDIRVTYARGDLSTLYEHLLANQPCIVFLKTGELPYWHRATDHAVVVVGMDDEAIYVNDPEFPTSPFRISLGDFDLAWLERDEMYAVLTR